MCIDSPVYPSFRIYDVVSKEEERRTVITTRLATKYPAIAICEFPGHDVMTGTD
jgi:hypothetical protein